MNPLYSSQVEKQRNWYQVYRITSEGEEPYRERFQATPEEAAEWERSLNEFETTEDFDTEVKFVGKLIRSIGRGA